MGYTFSVDGPHVQNVVVCGDRIECDARAGAISGAVAIKARVADCHVDVVIDCGAFGVGDVDASNGCVESDRVCVMHLERRGPNTRAS